MQFLARSLSNSIRSSLNSRARQQSWVLSQRFHSTSSVKSSFTQSESVIPEKSSEAWPRPTKIPYQPKIANSIDLVGYVKLPVQFQANHDGSFYAGTVISNGPSSDSDTESDPKFLIPVVFEGELAHTANCHLKKNDRVHITGQVFVDTNPSGAEPDQEYVQVVQVMVRDLHYIDGSKALPKVLPTSSDQKEGVLKHSASLQQGRNVGTDDWFDLLHKSDEWRDYRESKQNGSVHPKHPDFKKKDGSVALWLNKAPKEILSDLKDVKFDIPVKSTYPKQPKVSLQQVRNVGTDHWFDLLHKSDEWRDYRESKQNGSVHPKYPDFKKKDGSVSLWLNKAPKEILSDLKDVKFQIPVQSTYPKQSKAGEEAWKELVENMNNWWDNRLSKQNVKGPDFVHKDTRVALWLTDCPSWVMEKLPPPKEPRM